MSGGRRSARRGGGRGPGVGSGTGVPGVGGVPRGSGCHGSVPGARLAAALLAVAAATLGGIGVSAQVPVREEKPIYSVLAFNGQDYSSTFMVEPSRSLYLLADVDNFVSVRKTLVYFWPLTNDWKADSTSLNEVVAGTLEITGSRGSVRQELTQQWFTYYNRRGVYEQNWEVAVADQALAEFARFEQQVRDFQQVMREHARLNFEYSEERRRISDQIDRLMAAGEDFSALVAQRDAMSPPPEPLPPTEFVVPPAAPQQAFVVKLPVGEYDIRLRTPAGNVLEGSEARLVVFARRRGNSVGHEVIPADQWTRAVESTAPRAVVYVDGSADLFLRPFLQDEMNDLYYRRLRRNQAAGNPNIVRWIRIQQVPQARVVISGASGPTREVREQPYLIEQTTSTALGYRIVALTPELEQQGRVADLRAFHVPLPPGTRRVQVAVRDAAGQALPTGARQIRVVAPAGPQAHLLAVALVPLVALLWWQLARRRRHAD